MVNPETMATLGTQDTGRRKTKKRKTKKKISDKVRVLFSWFVYWCLLSLEAISQLFVTTRLIEEGTPRHWLCVWKP
jgi:hypothetical protein